MRMRTSIKYQVADFFSSFIRETVDLQLKLIATTQKVSNSWEWHSEEVFRLSHISRMIHELKPSEAFSWRLKKKKQPNKTKQIWTTLNYLSENIS